MSDLRASDRAGMAVYARSRELLRMVSLQASRPQMFAIRYARVEDRFAWFPHEAARVERLHGVGTG